MSLKRRKLLSSAAGLTALTVPLSGCMLWSNSDGTLVIEQLSAYNRDRAPHTIHVLITEGGDPVFWESVRAESYDEKTNRLGGETVEDLPDGEGSYVIYTWIDDQPRSKWEKESLAKYNSDCVSVIVMVVDQTSNSEATTNIRVSTKCTD